jgi:hypothetical protein
MKLSRGDGVGLTKRPGSAPNLRMIGYNFKCQSEVQNTFQMILHKEMISTNLQL